MKFYLKLYLTLLYCQLTVIANRNIVCYYDVISEERKGLGHFTTEDLERALEFCTHIIYGYAGINATSMQLTSLNKERDIERGFYRAVTALKAKYPSKKFLLSMGGDKDMDLKFPDKYTELLESSVETQKSFIQSVVQLLRTYNFDGLDLAFQFPRNTNNKEIAKASWKSLRKLFRKELTDKDFLKKDHKTQFSLLIENLRLAFKPHNLMLCLTVLPNVNAFSYFNASALVNNFDFINLQTFDFITPESSPSEATYTAPLYALPTLGYTNTQHCIDYQVNYWIVQRVPSRKINVGIAAYGRAWKLTKNSRRDGFPKIMAANGTAPASNISNAPGILTWSEICPMLANELNANKTGAEAPLFSVLDPHKDFVTYAFRPADINGEHGIWISYDDPRIVAIKAAYVKHRHLGGIAFYDVSLDDFYGVCNGDTFPMLRYIKYTFL